MMTFTELNSVEHYIIYQLSGINLNNEDFFEAPLKPFGAEWQYQSSEQLGRNENEVLIESQVKEALIRLNPEISAKQELADEVIYVFKDSNQVSPNAITGQYGHLGRFQLFFAETLKGVYLQVLNDQGEPAAVKHSEEILWHIQQTLEQY